MTDSQDRSGNQLRILLFANTDWYLYNFRRSLARQLCELGHDVLLVSPPGPYGAKLSELGFRWTAAPMSRRSLNPVRELGLVLWLRRLIDAERIDLVHGFTIKCAVYGSLAGRLARGSGRSPGRVGAIAGMGYVFTSDHVRARVLRPVIRTLLRLALGGDNVRLILQNEDDLALCSAANLIGKQHLRLIPSSGVDTRRFTPLSETSRRSRVRVLLPARLLWDKGIAEYAEAARRVRAGRGGVEFLLAGSPDPGNPASVPEGTVREWVEEGILTWLGHVADMAALFQTVDVVVLPSYREGLPKGLIEAAACALPLITTDVPGCREVVTHGVNGLLVPARDPGALAAAIELLASDERLRHKLGAAARSNALEKYDERIVIERTLQVYREVIA